MKARILASTSPMILAAAITGGCATTYGDDMNVATEPPVEAQDPAAAPEASGYFAARSDLPFYAPDFTKISEDDYLPAFEQAMAIHAREIANITRQRSAPTFENTIVALEKSGQMLNRVSAVFYHLTGANTTDRLDEINSEISPRLTAHYDAINLDPQLFARVKAVYDNRAAMTMMPEDAVLLENTYRDMVHAGALLTDAEREQVKVINAELSTLTTDFSQAVRAATNDQPLIVETAEELAGLSESDLAAAAKLASEKGHEGKYAIALQNTTQQPLLPELDNRDVRERFFKLSAHRSDGTYPGHDTRVLLARIAALRAQKATLFGEPDWASYAMYDRMAKTPQTALDFMGKIVPALAATQRREAEVLNERIAQDGKNFSVEPWDWYRYSSMVKEEQYAFDDSVLTDYFQIDRVLEDGVFFMANKLYGLSFAKRDDLPVYHPDVSVYTVFEEDGSELGLFYFDPYQRPSKRGGAWKGNFVEQSHLWDTKPVIYNVLNIPKAPEGEPQLISFDNVETMFHEFGHAVHGLFANQRYESLSGTNVARDFVEYPSQVHEMWAVYPEVLRNYAKHHQTGEAIPVELIEKMDAASKFNQGYDFGEVVEAALLDMKWHSLSPEEAAAIDTPEKVDAFERQSLKELGLEIDLVPPRYRSTYFNHIFSSPTGYSAGYYSYLWTQMLDHDSRRWFLDNGGLTRANGDHYRKTVIGLGGTKEYFQMYRDFAGREPTIEPLLEARGLLSEDGE